MFENGAKFPKLWEISLRDNLITDVGVETLTKNGANFIKLRKIDLNSNKIRKAGEKIFNEAKLQFKIDF